MADKQLWQRLVRSLWRQEISQLHNTFIVQNDSETVNVRVIFLNDQSSTKAAFSALH